MFTIAGGWKLRLKRYSEGRLVFMIKILLETGNTKSVGREEAGFLQEIIGDGKFCQFRSPYSYVLQCDIITLGRIESHIVTN